MWGRGRGSNIVQESNRDDSNAIIVRFSKGLAVERHRIPRVFGAAPWQAAAGEVVGDLAAVLAQLRVPAVEEGGVGQGPRDADRDVAFAVVGGWRTRRGRSRRRGS